jgi:hypothetical protein
MRHTQKIALGLVSLALLGAGVTHAQETAQRPAETQAARQDDPRGFRGPHGFQGSRFDGPRGEGRRGGPGHMRGWRGAASGKYVEGRIAFLKAELKITDAQTRAWEPFAAFMRETAQTRNEAHAARRDRQAQNQPRERKTLVERLGDQEARLAAMAQQAGKRKAVTEALYKTLSDEQKKIAEELL